MNKTIFLVFYNLFLCFATIQDFAVSKLRNDFIYLINLLFWQSVLWWTNKTLQGSWLQVWFLCLSALCEGYLEQDQNCQNPIPIVSGFQGIPMTKGSLKAFFEISHLYFLLTNKTEMLHLCSCKNCYFNYFTGWCLTIILSYNILETQCLRNCGCRNYSVMSPNFPC